MQLAEGWQERYDAVKKYRIELNGVEISDYDKVVPGNLLSIVKIVNKVSRVSSARKASA